jgi:hypothetical protein
MPKRTSTRTTGVRLHKPQEILAIEKAYNLVFVEEELRDPDRGGLNEISYSFNNKGRVNGLSIYDTEIHDLNPLNTLELEYLNLTRNSITDISPLERQKKLKYLFIGGNKITKFDSLSNLVNLRTLAIWGNQVEDLLVLQNLTKLKNLYCQRTGLADLTFIRNLRNLSELSASENNISDLNILNEDIIINNIDLHKNKIKYISKDVAKKLAWFKSSIGTPGYTINRVRISENPLQFPPSSVIELGAETVESYYKAVEEFGHAPLSEGRIIVIGDGSAGKSSLIERILYNTFELGKSQTNGIKIEKLQINHSDNRPLKFHIWDFGGQEIQHAVHKFFFTEGCLYILVLDNRKEEEPEYWLQQIESLGGGAPVLVIFNKQDDNPTEIADRKFLREKYPNILGFHNISCKTGVGIDLLKGVLIDEAVKLSTVDEQFPQNWFKIKTDVQAFTSGSQHYIDYSTFRQICTTHHEPNDKTQKLLLKYFTTIGAITWFGDTFLNFFHVLSPTWITQGVYKIITAEKTSRLAGQINVSDFEELLLPSNETDYHYSESHYGYILSMMKKFDLCYTPDDEIILIPSAFGKMPKVEYHDFRGSSIRTYIFQFKDYMPIALIHRFIAKKLADVYDGNYWYTGIVIADKKSDSLCMVHADKEAKRIYVRIRGDAPLGMWEHIRREFAAITSSYARIPFDELISLDERSESTVNYEDLVSHLESKKKTYFHPRLQRDFNVGYLLGFFQSKDETIEKIKKGEITINEDTHRNSIPPVYLNIVNNISPNINTNVNMEINIDLHLMAELSSNLKGEANFLIDELKESSSELKDALQKVVEFSNDAKTAKNSNDLKEKGWGRKLKSIVQALKTGKEQLTHIKEGGESLKTIIDQLKELCSHVNFKEVSELISSIF